MIRQSAFIGSTPLLKGGLHCHTTRSDGAGSPRDVMLLHAENDYDFLAITDHRFYNYENYAPETGIVVVPGMEFDDTFCHDKGFRCFHTVCVGPSTEEGNGYAQDQRVDSGTAKDQEGYQSYLDDIHAHGNLTLYCHPEWSSTPARYFEKLRSNFAMEIWNSGCAIENDMDTDAAYWDELLGQGIRIFGAAVDDGHAMHQHCKGWVMVNSDKKLSSILKALETGGFYSSCGPVVKDFYVEDDIAHIETSPCSTIRFHSDRHPTPKKVSPDGSLTSWEIRLNGSYDYIRATVIDSEGRHAWTNPIWL